jgi:hypothetical protein
VTPILAIGGDGLVSTQPWPSGPGGAPKEVNSCGL